MPEIPPFDPNRVEYSITSVEIDGVQKWTLFHPIAGVLWLDQARDTREEAEAWLAQIIERRKQQ